MAGLAGRAAVGGDASRAFFDQLRRSLFHHVVRAGADAEAYRDEAAVPIQRFRQAAVIHRKLRRREDQLRLAGEPTGRRLRMNEVQEIEIPHLAREMRVEVLGVKQRDRANPGSPRDQRIPKPVAPHAARRDRPHAGDDDSCVCVGLHAITINSGLFIRKEPRPPRTP